jgi:hypothetical protein
VLDHQFDGGIVTKRESKTVLNLLVYLRELCGVRLLVQRESDKFDRCQVSDPRK